MNELYVIMYHYVRPIRDSRYQGIKGLEYNDFVRQIDFLKSNFTIITMDDVIKAYNKEVTLPDRSVLLTFDDGYIDCWTNVFPLLCDEGIQGSFFVPAEVICARKLMDVNSIQFILEEGDIREIKNDINCMIDEYRREGTNLPNNDILYNKYAIANRLDSSDTIYVKRLLQKVLPRKIRHAIIRTLYDRYVDVPERILADELYMNIYQLKHMRNSGMHIGIHGYEHVWGGEDLTKDEMNEWIDRSLDELQSCIDLENWTMSYPYGSFSNEMIEYIKGKGCQVAFLSQAGRAMVDERTRYKILRYDTNDFPPKGDGYLYVERLDPYR